MEESKITQIQKVDMQDVTVREMVDSDLVAVDQLWRADGAVLGVDILRFMFVEDLCQNKAFVAVYKGEIIGSGFAYILNDELGELGGFFIKPEFRNQGIGAKIWDARMKYLGDRNVMVKTNERRANKNVSLGFNYHLQDINFYCGVPLTYDLDPGDIRDHVDRIVSIHDANFDDLIAYDQTVNNEIDRKTYFKTLLGKYAIRGYVAYKNGVIVGYIGETPSKEVAVVAPWYAESSVVAKALLGKFISEVPKGLPMRFFTPVSNTEAKATIEGLGVKCEGSARVLLNKKAYSVEWNRIFSVCNAVTMFW